MSDRERLENRMLAIEKAARNVVTVCVGANQHEEELLDELRSALVALDIVRSEIRRERGWAEPQSLRVAP